MANRKRRNNDVAYEITNAIHRMVDAMQPDGSTTSSHDPTYSARAIHSFIPKECVGRLRLVMRKLGCELIVAKLASGEVSTNSVCVECPMEVASRRFKVNLICLPMEGLDVILGMNWLSRNHIVIDYGRRIVVFPDTEGLELISTHKAMKEIEVGATCFMIVAQGEKKRTTE
ncbi:uncharacterized protein LOC114174395 [Vigna unguiculata]|uniref:uncharacterized protein LOC114174395 n=1 Tax=Vigna unguiculata TaxID=3917 RepID=UPI00101601EA|nr:uncharacterized protein LOC114174395 [Vigna unguiculata]